MAEGTQSKEGLFEIMHSELENQNINTPTAHILAVGIINIIPDNVREDKKLLTDMLDNISNALLFTSGKI